MWSHFTTKSQNNSSGVSFAKQHNRRIKMKQQAIYTLILSTLLTMLAPLSHAGEGGSDTGAGNIIGSYQPSTQQIKELILSSKRPAKFVLFDLESDLSNILGDKIYATTRSKLFQSKRTIYDALNEAQFVVEGPCYDNQGNQVQASAVHSPELCFDPQMIIQQNKLNSDNVQKEILALVIHEVSHMVGTTDIVDPATKLNISDAYFVQQQIHDKIKSNTPYQDIEKTIQSFKKDFWSALKSRANRDIEKMIDLDPQQNQSLAAALIFMLQSVLPFSNYSDYNQSQNGYSIFRPDVADKLFVIQIKNSLLMNYSFRFKQKDSNILYRIFKNKNEISVYEYLLITSDTPKEYNSAFLRRLEKYKKYRLRKITFGDTAAYNIEKAEIDQLLKQVANQLTVDFK